MICLPTIKHIATIAFWLFVGVVSLQAQNLYYQEEDKPQSQNTITSQNILFG